ncbi:MAG TPA: adenylate/guanylate cyclase domain-containing protein [Xanthobacteraceae bacterium]|jgi:adenylate cyclase|nr:adenylate/guanylate cyclase domain-containing protein [Xanthobacteraceae bacterium]
MQAFVGNLIHHKPRRALSPEFKHALAREVLKTERLRIIALIITAIVLAAALTTTDMVAPAILDRIWRGHFPLVYVWAGLGGFVLFEASVLALVSRQLKRDLDVPTVRRYLGAFIETSLPSLLLVAHMSNMGAAPALGFVAPLLYFVFIILSTLRLDFWLSTFTGFVAATEVLGLALFHPAARAAAGDPMLTTGFLISRSAVIFACGVLAGAVGVQLRRQFEASIAAATARDHVTNLFGQHVSPQVVDRLLAAGSTTSSDARQVAVMFVDIRGFTAAARTRAPQEVVDRLDAAFAVLVEIVDRNGGIVNKFLGDGFLALFGAPFDDPDAARRAVTAAREMLAAIEQHNVRSDWPLRIGIGLHFGNVVAGNVGSPRRKEYTVIGDTVNLASRIEGLNKQFGSQLLISDAVRQAIGQDVDATPLGDVAIRGYEQPVRVWRLA